MQFEQENDMVQMTIDVPDALAQRCKSIGPWLSTIIELTLAGFKTQASATVSEIIDFLSENPEPDEITNFHVSETAQSRLCRLLALNEAWAIFRYQKRKNWMNYNVLSI